MGLKAFVMEPLQGRTSLNTVVWGYGFLGSILYGVIELFLNSNNAIAMRLYVIGGFVVTLYAAVATLRCAGNCTSKVWSSMARVSAWITLVLLPVFAYLELTGALNLSSLEVL